MILSSALAEGSGAALMLDAQPIALALFAIAVIARAFAWSAYRGALRQPGAKAVLEPAGKALLQLGTVAPLALLAASALLPEAAVLAGIAAIVAGWRFKFVLEADRVKTLAVQLHALNGQPKQCRAASSPNCS